MNLDEANTYWYHKLGNIANNNKKSQLYIMNQMYCVLSWPTWSIEGPLKKSEGSQKVNVNTASPWTYINPLKKNINML